MTVWTKDGKYIEVGQFYSGGWYARRPKWFPFDHEYLVKADTKAEVLEFLASVFDIDTISD